MLRIYKQPLEIIIYQTL